MRKVESSSLDSARCERVVGEKKARLCGANLRQGLRPAQGASTSCNCCFDTIDASKQEVSTAVWERNNEISDDRRSFRFP